MQKLHSNRRSRCQQWISVTVRQGHGKTKLWSHAGSSRKDSIVESRCQHGRTLRSCGLSKGHAKRVFAVQNRLIHNASLQQGVGF